MRGMGASHRTILNAVGQVAAPITETMAETVCACGVVVVPLPVLLRAVACWLHHTAVVTFPRRSHAHVHACR